MDYKRASDIELWTACKQDDEKAYAHLFERYFPKAYLLSTRSIRDREVAEELVMDVFVNLWQKRVNLNITDHFAAYLLRSVQNTVINHLQKKPILYVHVESLDTESFIDSAQADDRIQYDEADKTYQHALGSLSPQRQMVFRLSREENLTFPEIAAETGLSVNTVRNHVVAALSVLRQSMADYTTVIMLVGLLMAAY